MSDRDPEGGVRIPAWPAMVAMARADAAAEVDVQQARCARLERAIEDALTHFHIGQETANALLPVDWWYVARRMRDALLAALDAVGEDEQAQEPAE